MNERMESKRYEEGIGRHRDEKRKGFSIWHAVGGVAVLGLATLLAVSMPDIVRYIKISRM